MNIRRLYSDFVEAIRAYDSYHKEGYELSISSLSEVDLSKKLSKIESELKKHLSGLKKAPPFLAEIVYVNMHPVRSIIGTSNLIRALNE